jgi:hypothetical protein
MKAMLDYCMWNSTLNPQGPPSIYDEQTLYDTYAGGDDLNANEMAAGLNTEIDDYHHGWIYGYFFAPFGFTTSSAALRDICTWIDYPVDFYNGIRDVDVPKPGHTNHVPVAIPLEGEYDHWVSVRGIFTNHDAWNYSGPLEIYGFWLNDPTPDGLGNNVYVTADTLLNEYYYLMDETGDPFDQRYVTITDPPQIPGVEIPEYSNVPVIIASAQPQFTTEQARLVSQATFNGATKMLTDRFVVTAAEDAARSVLPQSPYADQFNTAVVTGTPVYEHGSCIVQFVNTHTTFFVKIDAHTGCLKQIQVE